MEQYVYFSIIFFSLIIFFLYIYILYEKTMEMYKNKKIENYSKELLQYIDSTIDRVKNGEDIDHQVMENLKSSCKNKYKREIIEKRLLNYFEDSKVNFLKKITKLCEYIGIVEYEINKLKSKNNLTKALSAKRLGQFRSHYGIKPLLKEINIKDNDVKYNVLMSLAKIGNEQAFITAFENIDSLLNLSERSLIEIVDSFEGDKNSIYKHMINSDNSLVACVFIKSAGNHRHMSLSSDISKYLFSEDKERRIAAVKAIGNIGDTAYLDDIIKLLEDSEWEVRAVTAKALGSFTDSKILMPLAKSLSDSQWYVRYNAAISILNHEEGMNIIEYVFGGKDKFAKDIIISAMENSPNNKLKLYENSEDYSKRSLADSIKTYISMKKRVG